MKTNNQIKDKKNTRTGEVLDRNYVWALFDLLPSFGFFKLEVRDGEEVIDDLQFSKNTDAEEGKKRLYELLGRYPGSFGKIDAEFSFGFGFDLKVRIWL